MAALNLATIRRQFPSLTRTYIFADAASGAQVHESVIQRINTYFLNYNVQAGGQCALSQATTQLLFDAAPTQAMQLFNASSKEEIVFSSSSTQNVENLARSLEGDVLPNEELVIAAEHEAHCGPWIRLAARCAATLYIWKPRKAIGNEASHNYEVYYDVQDLLAIMSKNTRIIAFPAASNIFGSVLPIKKIVSLVRKAAIDLGCRKVEVSLDCVAYAAHRRMDVKEWDIDYAVFSFYKIGGPHISALYVREATLHHSISNINHSFIQSKSAIMMLGRPGAMYELAWSTTGLVDYYRSLTPDNSLEHAFSAIQKHEQDLTRLLLTFLSRQEQHSRGVRILGHADADDNRLPTVSFVILGVDSQSFVHEFSAQNSNISIRGGNCWAYRLVDSLQPRIDPECGVIRVSFVHYNTKEEVLQVVDALRNAFSSLPLSEHSS